MTLIHLFTLDDNGMKIMHKDLQDIHNVLIISHYISCVNSMSIYGHHLK